MPPPKTASEVDLRPGTVRAENILKEACITREYMDEHSDPELKGAAAAQDELFDVTSSGPAEYREQEGATLERARTDASATGQSGVAGLHGARAEAFEAVAGQQTGAKGANEGKREAAAAEIDAIFTSTQSKVTARLTKLDTDVNRTFDTDANAAVSKFTAFIDRNAEAHKKSWFETAAEWLNEALFDAPPPEVQDF